MRRISDIESQLASARKVIENLSSGVEDQDDRILWTRVLVNRDDLKKARAWLEENKE